MPRRTRRTASVAASGWALRSSAGPFAEEQPDRRAVESELLAQLVLQEALVAEVNTGRVPGEDVRQAGLDADADVVTQICHLLEPLIQVAVRHPENFSNYYRCIFFTPAGEHRAQALEHLAMLEEQIGQLLSADPSRALRGGIAPREAGRILWASMSLELIGLALGHTCYQDVHDARVTLVRAAYADGRNARSCWLMLDSE